MNKNLEKSFAELAAEKNKLDKKLADMANEMAEAASMPPAEAIDDLNEREQKLINEVNKLLE